MSRRVYIRAHTEQNNTHQTREYKGETTESEKGPFPPPTKGEKRKNIDRCDRSRRTDRITYGLYGCSYTYVRITRCVYLHRG